MKTSIIIPAFNEELAIRDVVEEVRKSGVKDKEIIVVDDGSSDGTYRIAKGLDGIKVFRHATNMGKASALSTGFKNATGSVLVTIDADCTYPAKDIPKIIRPVIEGRADMVIGSRFLKGGLKMSRLNYHGNMFFSRMVSFLTGIGITDASTGMRAFRKSVWESIDVKSKGLDWEVEMTTRVLRKGFRVEEISIDYEGRVGQTKLKPFKDGPRFFFAILRGCL